MQCPPFIFLGLIPLDPPIRALISSWLLVSTAAGTSQLVIVSLRVLLIVLDVRVHVTTLYMICNYVCCELTPSFLLQQRYKIDELCDNIPTQLYLYSWMNKSSCLRRLDEECHRIHCQIMLKNNSYFILAARTRKVWYDRVVCISSYHGSAMRSGLGNTPTHFWAE